MIMAKMASTDTCNLATSGKGLRHASLRIKFSALSFGVRIAPIFNNGPCINYNANAIENEEDVSCPGDAKDGLRIPTEPCFVTFSVNVFFKEQGSDNGWVLCSTAETKPILCAFERKQNGMMTFLLRYTKNLKLFLCLDALLYSGVDVEGHRDLRKISESVSPPAENIDGCGSSNRILECQRFKIAIGAAVIRSGRVIYVGHGFSVLRSIDLFGKRITLSISGDSCNHNDYSMNRPSNAYVFFDIGVKHVQWVPCAEHCKHLHGPIPLNDISPRYYDAKDSENFLVVDPSDTSEDELGHSLDSLNNGMRNVRNSAHGCCETESQRSSFRSGDKEHKFCYINDSRKHFIAEDVPNTVYVGSNPKYRISVLNINHIAGNLNNDISIKKNRKKKQHLVKKDAHENMHVVEDETEDVVSQVEGVDCVAEAAITPESIINGVTRDGITSDNENSGISGLLRSVLVGSNNNIHIDSGPENIVEECASDDIQGSSTSIPENTRKIIRMMGHQERLECVLKIGKSTLRASEASLLKPITCPLYCFLDQLEEIKEKKYHNIQIKSIKIKPNRIGLFLFTVAIPEAHEGDLSYTRKALSCFSNLTSNSISEVEFVFHIWNSKDSGMLDEKALRNYLENIKLDCEMFVKNLELNNSTLLDNNINIRDGFEPLTTLRKLRSETALYYDNTLANAIEKSKYMEGLRCVSERDNISIDTWINAIHQILTSSSEEDLIQITSPRTSLPINLDKKWAVLLKQLLGNVKAESDKYQLNEGVKFIWPTT